MNKLFTLGAAALLALSLGTAYADGDGKDKKDDHKGMMQMDHEGKKDGKKEGKKEGKKAVDPKVAEERMAKLGGAYPLKTSPVKGADVSGANAIDYSYKGRALKFSSKEEIADFEKDPKKYLGDVDKKIIEMELPKYTRKTCLVNEGDELSEDAVNYVYGNRLVRFCCGMCKKEFNADPEKFLARLDAKPAAGEPAKKAEKAEK